MTWFTHINRGVIDANRSRGEDNPPITTRKGKRGKATYAHEIELPAGSRIVYSPHEPILPCGARCVITSEFAPVVVR